jgi:hypothetical protein
MIFIYPALVSRDIPDEYVLGICKTLEFYYLQHVMEAITSDNLKFKVEWDRNKKNWGPIEVSESVIQKSDKLLLEDYETSSIDQLNKDLLKITEEYNSKMKLIKGLELQILNQEIKKKEIEHNARVILSQYGKLRINDQDDSLRKQLNKNLLDNQEYDKIISEEIIRLRNDISNTESEIDILKEHLFSVSTAIASRGGSIPEKLKPVLSTLKGLLDTTYQIEKKYLDKKAEAEKENQIKDKEIKSAYDSLIGTNDISVITSSTEEMIQNIFDLFNKEFPAQEITDVRLKKNNLIDKFEKTKDEIRSLVNEYNKLLSIYKNKISKTDVKNAAELLAKYSVTGSDVDRSSLPYGVTDELIDIIDKIKIVSEKIKIKAGQLRGNYDSADKYYDQINKTELQYRKEKLEKDKQKIDELKFVLDRIEKSKVKASYDIRPLSEINPVPTMQTVQAIVEYQPIPLDVLKKYKNTSLYNTLSGFTSRDIKNISLPVGVKVIPSKVSSTSPIIDMLLTDYFASWWQMRSRQFKNWLKKVYDNLPFIKWFKKSESFFSMPFVGEKNVEKDIFSKSKGFIDASTFYKGDHYAPYEKLTAAIVILRVEDLLLNDENFFERSGAFTKMFRMGWNSIVFMDESQQRAYFISYLEGGNTYILPYSFIFKALKMDDVYKNLDLMRKHSPSKLYPGGLTSLLKDLKRRNLKEFVERKLNTYNEELLKEKAENLINKKLNIFS